MRSTASTSTPGEHAPRASTMKRGFLLPPHEQPPAEAPEQPPVPAQEEEEEEEAVVVQEPLCPSVEVHTPWVESVTAHTASLQWEPAIIVRPEDDGQHGDQQRYTYEVVYHLEMQQEALKIADRDQLPEVLHHQAVRVLREEPWRHEVWRRIAEGQQHGGKVLKLLPGRFYAARLAATVTAVSTDPEELPVAFPPVHSGVVVVHTTATPPTQPRAPALASRARTVLKLKWTEPEETGGEPITQYQLVMQPRKEPHTVTQSDLSTLLTIDEEEWWSLYTGLDLRFTVTSLLPGQRYSFRIQATNRIGNSEWSLVSSFSTQPSVPSAPQPPQQIAASKDSVTLTWTPPPDNGAAITGYRLEADDGRGGEFSLAHVGLDRSATVSRLSNGLPYRFRLRAENSEGHSQWSAATAVRTLAAAPGCPTGLTLRGNNRTSITLGWQPPASDGGSPLLGYQVELQAQSPAAQAALGSDWCTIYDGHGAACTFAALQPGCTYRARVNARNAAGCSVFTVPLSVSTAPDVPGQPDPPSAEIESTSLMLRWAPPAHDGGTPVLSFRVELRCSPTANDSEHLAALAQQNVLVEQQFMCIYNGPDTSINVYELSPGTAYEYRALAVNAQGASEWSEVGTATTRAAPPLPPAAPVITGATSSSLQLAWQPPFGQGAPVTTFTVNLGRVVAAPPRPPSAASVLSDGSGNGLDAAAASALEEDGGSEPLRYETIYTGTATRCEARNLVPASTYRFIVRAHNAVGGSAWGAPATATTQAAAPGPPALPRLSPVRGEGDAAVGGDAATSRVLSLTWGPPADDHGAPVFGYQVEWARCTKGAPGTWSKIKPGGELRCGLPGLSAGRTYVARVRAQNAQGWGPWAEASPCVTPAAPPEAPRGPLQFSARTATAVKVRWAAPVEEHGARTSAYVLQVSCDERGEPWREAYKGAELTARVAELAPACTYAFRVAAVNAAGRGPWSEPDSVTTALRAPGPPLGVSAHVLPAGQEAGGGDAGAASAAPRGARVAVSWEPPVPEDSRADVVGYEVEAAPSAGRHSVGRSTSHVLTGLVPGAAYTVRVRSVGAAGAGHSEWGAAVAVEVPANAAAAPGSAGDPSEVAPAPAVTAPGGGTQAQRRQRAAAAAGGAGGGSDAAAPKPRRDRTGKAAVAVATARKPPSKQGLYQWLRKWGARMQYWVLAGVILVIVLLCILSWFDVRGK